MKATVYLADMADFSVMNEIYAREFGTQGRGCGRAHAAQERACRDRPHRAGLRQFGGGLGLVVCTVFKTRGGRLLRLRGFDSHTLPPCLGSRAAAFVIINPTAMGRGARRARHCGGLSRPGMGDPAPRDPHRRGGTRPCGGRARRWPLIVAAGGDGTGARRPTDRAVRCDTDRRSAGLGIGATTSTACGPVVVRARHHRPRTRYRPRHGYAPRRRRILHEWVWRGVRHGRRAPRLGPCVSVYRAFRATAPRTSVATAERTASG